MKLRDKSTSEQIVAALEGLLRSMSEEMDAQGRIPYSELIIELERAKADVEHWYASFEKVRASQERKGQVQ